MRDTTVFTLLSAVTTTGAGTAVKCASPGARFVVYSAAGSSCTVLIQGSDDNSTWHTLVTLTNPAAAPDGFAYQGTGWNYLRANVSARVSGTITAKMASLDHDPGPWNACTAPSNTATAIACTSVTNSGLTSGRIPYSTTGGLQTDNAGFLFDGSYQTVPSLKDSSGTATRVPYLGSAKELAYDSTLAFNSTTKALSATIHKGANQDTIAAKSGDGAIASAPGSIVITKSSALGSSTLATPTVTDHDGYILRITSSTAYAHVISCASGKVNGGTTTTITFTSAAVGDSITLEAYQGVWYIIGSRGTITLS